MCACFLPQKPRLIKLTTNKLFIYDSQCQTWHKEAYESNSYWLTHIERRKKISGLVWTINHFYEDHWPTTRGHFINKHWHVLSLCGATASTLFQSQDSACCCSEEHIHPWFPGRQHAWKCGLAKLTWDYNQMPLARQTFALASGFYRNRCNKQPHHRGICDEENMWSKQMILIAIYCIYIYAIFWTTSNIPTSA